MHRCMYYIVSTLIVSMCCVVCECVYVGEEEYRRNCEVVNDPLQTTSDLCMHAFC